MESCSLRFVSKKRPFFFVSFSFRGSYLTGDLFILSPVCKVWCCMRSYVISKTLGSTPEEV